jgi:competence protein ComEA
VDDRRWQTLAWGIAAVAVVVLGVRLLGSHAEPPPVRVDAPAPGVRGGTQVAARPSLYVHVAGAVRRPGLYRVGDQTRVAVALARAGGPTPQADLAGVNLAAPLEDGQQIVVPTTAGVRGSATVEGSVSLGTATAQQLEELDGIGPTLAERIVERRQASGGFSSVEDLREVEGIGEKRLEALRDALAP